MQIWSVFFLFVGVKIYACDAGTPIQSKDYKDRYKNMLILLNNISYRSVMDLGCGDQYLRSILSAGVEYAGVDLHGHKPDTIVSDFNKKEFPSITADICFCAEVFEFVKDVDWFIDKITHGCKYVVGSYVLRRFEQQLSVNNFTVTELIAKFINRSWELLTFDHEKQLFISRISPEQNILKFARLATKYQYAKNWKVNPLKDNYSYQRWWIEHPRGNYGDCFQGFAVENLYSEFGIPKSKVKWVNRDEINVYAGEKVVVVMQGYFGMNLPLVWSSSVIPVYLGFHLEANMKNFFEESGAVEKMKNLGQALGCRDRRTADFLRSMGINAYFSGCMTLTFSKRTKDPKNGKVFVVDIAHRVASKMPHALLKKAVIRTQEHRFQRGGNISEEEYNRFEDEANQVFWRFKTEARLIITSRIHVAMPAVAMGIPVVFIHKNKNDCRFDVLQDIIKIYSPKEIGSIDWNPIVPNIEFVKDLIKANAVSRIKEAVEREEHM